jgi:hypothetical protein
MHITPEQRVRGIVLSDGVGAVIEEARGDAAAYIAQKIRGAITISLSIKHLCVALCAQCRSPDIAAKKQSGNISPWGIETDDDRNANTTLLRSRSQKNHL